MATGLNQGRRVIALEQRKKARGAFIIPMIDAELNESSGDAVARYVAENGPLREVDEGDVNIIVWAA